MSEDLNFVPSACYGKACPKRGTCQLYENVGIVFEGIIESCQVNWQWPLYQPVEGETMD